MANATLASIPIWYFANLVGQPLGGGFLAAYNAADPSVIQPIYQDSNSNFPFPLVNIPNTNLQGISIAENGNIFQALYFSNNITYFLQAYDFNGVLQWTVPFFSAPTGGGGGDTTEALNFNNLLVNPVFWRANVNSSVSGTVNTFLCPSAHSNFCQSTVSSTTTSDIRFIKSNTSATDTLTFIPFTAGSNVFPANVTPPTYLNYTCTNAGALGETYKYIRIPITTDIQSTSGQQLYKAGAGLWFSFLIRYFERSIS